MSRIFRDSSVLNQFGSPSLNSNLLVNRPAFGQVGRLFVDTTNNVIYRDTGTSWALITGGAGAIPNLQQVTTVGNTTSAGIFIGITGSLTPGLQLEVSGYSRFSQTVGSASNLGSNVNQYFELQTSGTTISTGSPSAGFSQLILNNQAAQTIGGAGNAQIGAGLFENVITDPGTGSYPLTITQTVGISALSPIISYGRYTGTFGSTISHYAGLVINGIQATASSAIAITNNYQLLINSSQQFSGSTTVTNRWGIYQAGANDVNYFASKVLINNLVASSYQLDVSGSVRFKDGGSYPLIIEGGVNATMQIYQSGSSCLVQLGVLNTSSPNIGRTGTINNFDFAITTNNTAVAIASKEGNFLIGTSTNTTRKLVVGGEAEFITTVGTGTHTTSGNHLPIWVNGVQYWLALLNPPILP